MDIVAKKSLGQNFLKDEAVLAHIIEAANLTKDDVVLEIGPGQGALTEKLAAVCKQVIAIEIDERMVELLHTKLVGNNPPAGGVEIIAGDILKINLPELISGYGFQASGYKVVANLPYYITSPIIRLLLETKYPPAEMVVMVQKEVAERIVAKKGAMSILAVSVQYYAKAQFLFTVFRQSFDPMPKVDSAVLKISSIASSPSGEDVRRTDEGSVASKEETKKFFRIVRAGFSAKRKTLINNLSNGLQLEKKEIEMKLVSLGFSPNTRAQELGVEDWRKLADILN
ncbi:MAG: 16S rRNA (adenine(1518)-N(6)/adenine(1519)-N(6))-dimethyltransferase RsmA [Candidatus Moraniibacteriota bacterium]